MKVLVLTAADGAGWEAQLLSELAAADCGIEVARRCVDVVDLLSAAAAGLAAVALVDVRLRRFDADARVRLEAAGAVVVGVVEPESEDDQLLLRELGVRYFVPARSAPAVVLTVLQAALTQEPTGRTDLNYSDPGSAWSSSSAAGFDTSGDLATSSGAIEGSRAEPATRGSVIAVWGPTGAPGRTTVAINTADEIARSGVPALLVDADVYGGVIAAALGVLDESAGIAAACRQAQSNRLDTRSLAALGWQVSPHLQVLTGIARADRWPEVRPSALTAVLSTARTVAAFTVVDIGFCVETDEELSFDTLAPRRNGATLAVLDEADLILAVGTADAIGIQRLIRGLEELKAAGTSAPVWIVLNRVRGAAVPGNPERELAAALDRFTGRSAAAFLPYDRAAADAAVATGQTLAEVSPNSPLRRRIRELAFAVTGIETPTRRHRRR